MTQTGQQAQQTRGAQTPMPSQGRFPHPQPAAVWGIPWAAADIEPPGAGGGGLFAAGLQATSPLLTERASPVRAREFTPASERVPLR
jgi:hypothetical protein